MELDLVASDWGGGGYFFSFIILFIILNVRTFH